MAGRRGRELLGARKFPLHRAAGFQRRQDTEVLGEQFLLAAESAPHVFGKNVELLRIPSEQIGELDLYQVRSLGAGADMDAIVRRAPGDGTVSLHVSVLDLAQL